MANIKWLICGIAACLISTLPAAGFCHDLEDLNGNWRIHTTSHRGYENWEMKIAVKDGKSVLSCVQPFIGRCDGVLALDGDRIKMEFFYKAPEDSPGDIKAGDVVTTFVFSGKVDGETMHGTKTTIGNNTHGDDTPVAWVALKRHESY